jgi:hypothetical protein
MRISCEETMKEVTANVTRERPGRRLTGSILLTKVEHVIS